MQRAVALTLGTAVLAWVGAPTAGGAQGSGDEPPPPPDAAPPDERERRARLPPFLQDTSLTLRLRTHYGDVQTVTPVEREAWAIGGWLAYRSGWLLDRIQIGATAYGAAPLYAPADKDGTLLLAPGQEGYHVVGEAFVAVRHREHASLTAYRQVVQQTYINRLDNRMTPNTFEGVTLGGTIRGVRTLAGYLTRIKTRNADRFVPMSEAAGAPGTDRGVALLGATAEPLPGLTVEVSEQYGVDTFNTAFVQIERVWHIGRGARLLAGAQLTDQRAVGDALVARASVERWATFNGSGRIGFAYRDLTLRGSASVTGAGNRIQTPWGVYPGYLRLGQQFFNNAGEKAWHAGVAYDLSSTLVRGLGAFADFAWGAGSVDPVTRARLPAEAEYDLTLDYRPPRIRGLWFRLRGFLYDQAGAERLGYQLRFIVNWDIALL